MGGKHYCMWSSSFCVQMRGAGCLEKKSSKIKIDLIFTLEFNI